MTEAELKAAEHMAEVFAGLERERALHGDIQQGVALNGSAATTLRTLAAEVRRLKARLEETESLLARAAIDSEAFGLGRQDGLSLAGRLVRREWDRVRALRDGSFLDSEEWQRFNRVAHYLDSLKDAVRESTEEVLDPLPPERLQDRIRRLEEALDPFVTKNKGLVEIWQGVGAGERSLRYAYASSLNAGLDVPTVDDVRRATKTLEEQS